MRSASSFVEEGSLVPALMTASLNGSCAGLFTSRFLLVVVCGSAPVLRAASQFRVLRRGFRSGVLIRGPAGDVVAAVGVGARLARRLVPVFGADQAGVSRGR